MRLSILVNEGNTVHLDVTETDFVTVAKKIACEGFGMSEPGLNGATRAVWFPPGAIKRIVASLEPSKP